MEISIPSLGSASIPVDLALIAGRAIFLVFCFLLAAVAFTRWRRSADSSGDRFMERTALLLDRLAGLEAQLAATNERLAEVGERIDSNLQRATPATNTQANYQIAIRLAKTGSGCEELMASCGLTRQEAEIVHRLHAPKRPRAA
jgi:hypothetical protein